jgi:hypothetical protein
MEQTAVSWYAQQEIELTLEFLAKKISELDYGLRRLNLLNQAKEMEKQQIIDAWENGYEHGACVNEDEAKYHGIQYYNETFKNKNNEDSSRMVS